MDDLDVVLLEVSHHGHAEASQTHEDQVDKVENVVHGGCDGLSLHEQLHHLVAKHSEHDGTPRRYVEQLAEVAALRGLVPCVRNVGPEGEDVVLSVGYEVTGDEAHSCVQHKNIGRSAKPPNQLAICNNTYQEF